MNHIIKFGVMHPVVPGRKRKFLYRYVHSWSACGYILITMSFLYLLIILYYKVLLRYKIFSCMDILAPMTSGPTHCTSIQTCQVFCICSQRAKFMGPTWGPPGSCRPQMGPMLAQWTLLSEFVSIIQNHTVYGWWRCAFYLQRWIMFQIKSIRVWHTSF